MTAHPPPQRYEIKLKGHLRSDWQSWFDGATVKPAPDGNTLLICLIVDQAELFGLLRKVRDLGVPLISVNAVPNNQHEVT
ncbi:MAG: hypothetical protein AAF125_26330, partial [Chloroflexota bacterium]